MKTLTIGLFCASITLGACASQNASDLQPGLAAIHEGRYVEAERHFTGMVKKDPTDPYALLNLGVAQARLGKNEQAAESYRLAIRNGESAPVRSLVVYQSDQDVESTVSAVASRNLAQLGG